MLIIGAVLIFFFGGGKDSGFRLPELSKDEVEWVIEGGSIGGVKQADIKHTGPLRELFFSIRLDKMAGGGAGGGDKEVSVAFASCRLGWPTNDIMRVVARDLNGTAVTARVVEWDAEKKRKLAEVIVVKGKLKGPAYAWDAEGRLLHQMDFDNDFPIGKSTTIERDAEGKEVRRRLLWWDKDRFSTEQVYLMASNRIDWIAEYENSRLKVLRRWVNKSYEPFTDPGSGELKRVDKKIVFQVVPGRRFQKIMLSSFDVFGMPKEAGGFVDMEGNTAKNPTFGDMKETTKDTPWEQEIGALFTGKTGDLSKSRFDKEEQPGGRGGRR